MRVLILLTFFSSLVISCQDRNINISNLESIKTCPEGFIRVPLNKAYEDQEFCVTQFEMKNDGFGMPVSQASTNPWVSIDRNSAITACQNLGPNYNLISNAQWQVIARNISLVRSNWENGAIGTDSINRGHSDNTPSILLSVANTNDGYNATGNNDTESWGSGGEQKRTHTLSNGEIIWDFSGNAAEWVKDINGTNYGSNTFISEVTGLTHLTLGTLDDGAIRAAKDQFGPLPDFSSLNSGEHGGLGYGIFNSTNGGIVRGGDYNDGVNAGIFHVDLSHLGTAISTSIGFRCVYSL